MIIKQYSGAKDPEKTFDRTSLPSKGNAYQKESEKIRQNFLRTSFEDQNKLKSVIVSPSNQLMSKNFAKSKPSSPEKQNLQLKTHDTKPELETEDLKKKIEKNFSPVPIRDYKRPRVSHHAPVTSNANQNAVTELASRAVPRQNYNYTKPQFDSFLNDANGRGTSRRNSRFETLVKPGYREATGIH